VRDKIKRLLSRTRQQESGQAVVILVAAAIGLIAFVGLVTDVGLVYVQYGHLRRAVDAAAIAAAGQIRAGWTYTASLTIATQHIKLHNLDPDVVTVYVPPIAPISTTMASYSEYYYDVCFDTTSPRYQSPDHPEYEDFNLCSDPPRKRVRVEAWVDVPLAFLNVVGWHTVRLKGISEGEAATLDVALVLDTSGSMAFDTPGWGGGSFEDMSAFIDCCNKPISCTLPSPPAPPAPETFPACQPMTDVKAAAQSFVERLREPFDRVAVISFDAIGHVILPMTNTLTSASGSAAAKVAELEVYNEAECLLDMQTVYTPTIFPLHRWECASTNLGAGVAWANKQFTDPELRRDESVWVMIILSDGAANAAKGGAQFKGITYCPGEGCCPSAVPFTSTLRVVDGGTAAPFCRDYSSDTRHCGVLTDTRCSQAGIPYSANWPRDWSMDPSRYDADDFARDMADFACLRPPNGNFIVAFTIGMGNAVVSETVNTDPVDVGGVDVYAEKDAGEQLLRYIANVGYNGAWNGVYTNTSGSLVIPDAGGVEFDPCYGKGPMEDCGNYYYSPADINELNEVFAKIASRIFTRLTR